MRALACQGNHAGSRPGLSVAACAADPCWKAWDPWKATKPPSEPTSCIRESAFTAAQQNDWRIVKSDGKAGSIKTGERGECGCIRIGLIPAWRLVSDLH
jgi:hypothetical protein